MYASDSKWEYAVLEHQGIFLDTQQGDLDPQTPASTHFSVSTHCFQFGGQVQSVPRNMGSQQGSGGWPSPASTEVFGMNPPFLTGNQSPVLPGFTHSINANANAHIATPPASVVAPSSISSSPQELPIKPDLVSYRSVVQSCYMFQQQQQHQPAPFGHPINCNVCLPGDCLVSSGPDNATYNVHYHIVPCYQQQQLLPQAQAQPWAYNAVATLPSQTTISFTPVTSFPNMDGLQEGGLLGGMVFDNDNLSLSSSDSSVPQGFVIPDSPESLTLPSQLQDMEPEMQQQDEPQPQPQPQPQAAQRKKLPDVPVRAQTPDDVAEESSTTTEYDSSSDSDVSEDDFYPYHKTSQRKKNQTKEREERSLTPFSAVSESPVEPEDADISIPDASGIEHDRHARNKFLVSCRARGMTYREIKEAGKMDEAESTLRGRHRVLTKCKAQRMRKPKWTKKDIELLRTIVQARTWRKQKGKKTHILWGKVAADMIEAGSSYHFGALTCSNMWAEITDNSRRK